MSKKSKKHKKLKPEEAWAVFLVDTVIGAQLFILAQRNQKVALTISTLCKNFVMTLSREKVFNGEEKKFIQNASDGIAQIYNSHIGKTLETFLKEGMPKPKIITEKEGSGLILPN